MATHCPGDEKFKNLQSYTCKCPQCGAEQELFSDEIEKKRTCKQCGGNFDPKSCTLEAGVSKSPIGER